MHANKQCEALKKIVSSCDNPALRQDIFVKPELWPAMLVSRAVASIPQQKSTEWFAGSKIDEEIVTQLTSQNVFTIAQQVSSKAQTVQG